MHPGSNYGAGAFCKGSVSVNFKEFFDVTCTVRPSARQMAWFDTGFYGFVHFGVNTFTDREWGLGNENPSIFNPKALDCDQWAATAKAAGMKGLIITAKHHDGFCLWPSQYTEHSVKNSPFRGGNGDVVGEMAAACHRAGLKFGFYLSPWDRNSTFYGSEKYNDYYKDQLTELLTRYGDVFMVWFDGACGEGPNGKRQEYDFKGYIDLVRKYQPMACIFNDAGPDVRWIGNESGTARFAEWAVMPRELTKFAQVQTGPMPMNFPGALAHAYNTQPELGSVSNIITSSGLCFCPAETDMSIRPGWFWHENEEPHSLERLKRTYITSVGGNSGLNLNIPPDRNGLFDSRDAKRLHEFGNWLTSAFGSELTIETAKKSKPFGAEFELKLNKKEKIGYIELREDLFYGQRIESFLVDIKNDDGQWQTEYTGTTVGNKRIIPIDKITDEVKINVTFARGEVKMGSIKVFEG